MLIAEHLVVTDDIAGDSGKMATAPARAAQLLALQSQKAGFCLYLLPTP